MSDRKYRHSGYQDDDRDRDREPRQQSESPRPDGGRSQLEGGPRGRGLGSPAEVAVKCARCGRHVEHVEIRRDTTCPGCGDALHSCTNCTHFNTSASFECTRDIPARIESKTKGNECTLFEPKAVRELGPRNVGSTGAPKDPHAAFNALFKKK
jgi:hypothetical protein